ncbi:MAG: hypothetical protein JOY90_28995 [Bradyrhizobium sp.]|uniref:hypothetical protein n=1 Tax=Bradyrhizobium sp. TaxID=376 RepID=UPI001DACA44F|nr:hypothetical protein [Bradyrhizobium sp.]MBV9564447.1 hypothetical protein [Bradyrhizobium sp.]
MAAGEPLTFLFADDGWIPNNPAWPMLVYRGGIDLAGHSDPAQRIEAVFDANGWGRGSWRNGIFPYVHYHSMIHEVLGIARGRAKVRFGGDKGEVIEVKAGDVALLPAGTGHQRLEGSHDLLVIGGYPAGGTYNLCRGSKPEHDEAVAVIPNVPRPDSDPVFGKNGPLTRLWGA